MPKIYTFTIVETRKCYYDVEANSLEEAKKLAQDAYDKDECFLDIDDSWVAEGHHLTKFAMDLLK